MTAVTGIELFLKDELPRIGSGRRIVDAEVGHVWVTVRGKVRGVQRIRRSEWDELVDTSYQHKLRNAL